jgi:hypothetical protein
MQIRQSHNARFQCSARAKPEKNKTPFQCSLEKTLGKK